MPYRNTIDVDARSGLRQHLRRALRRAKHADPHPSPGRSWLVTGAPLVATAETWDRAQIVVQSLKSSERETLVPAGNNGRYLSTGHLVYALAGVMFAMPFDPSREIEGFLSKLGGVRLR